MNEFLLNSREFYWAHREAFRVGFVAAGLIVPQLVLMMWTLWRLRELSHIRERMSRLADGLALLTDTTEAGLSAIGRQVDGLSRAQALPKPATRATVNKRVATAVRKGRTVGDIASTEEMSES